MIHGWSQIAHIMRFDPQPYKTINAHACCLLCSVCEGKDGQLLPNCLSCQWEYGNWKKHIQENTGRKCIVRNNDFGFLPGTSKVLIKIFFNRQTHTPVWTSPINIFCLCLAVRSFSERRLEFRREREYKQMLAPGFLFKFLTADVFPLLLSLRALCHWSKIQHT